MTLNPLTHRGRFNLTRPISETVLLLFGFGMGLVNCYRFLTDGKIGGFFLAICVGLLIGGGPYVLLGFLFVYGSFLFFCISYVFAFLVLDAIYNVTVGAFIFWEPPLPKWRTLLFTNRIENHKYGVGSNQSEESKEMALYLCGRLDYYDPGHCA